MGAKDALDVLATALTPPFAPAALQATRFFRIARLLRLVRAFSLRNLLSLDGVKYAALIVVGTVVVGGATVASIETNQTMLTAFIADRFIQGQEETEAKRMRSSPNFNR